MGNEKDQKVKEAVLAAVQDDAGKKKLPCPDALRIAKENDVAPALVGRICNEEKIKIRHCALGCF
jgi:LAO/AO transport system kinase